MNPSLSFGEAGLGTLGRSPGLGFNLLAAPSHPSTLSFTLSLSGRGKGEGSGQWLILRLSSPSQWRDRAGFAPDFPKKP